METNPAQGSASYPKTASILALLGGLIIILGGVIFIGAAVYVIPYLNLSNVTVPHGMNPASLPGLISGVLTVMGSFGLACGLAVLVSATMLIAKVGQRRTWGVLILVFSVLSFIGLGGFVVGAVLGITGGILALRWKPSSP
jgi:asparagine N-glycosylation enzyme membrane subunit Stt3